MEAEAVAVEAVKVADDDDGDVILAVGQGVRSEAV